ncbi:OmpA family protein [Brachybacterium squillarum]|uniref:OmpA family protein n=1 Tax=Brachybacterium squillarum TaxID=661979 RepID=UPI0002629B51|nr:OmpA family protein [Brachybacterium squillarum]
MRRRIPSALGALGLLLLAAPTALAEEDVIPLSTNIVPLATNITPLAEVEEGEEGTTITLSSDVLFDTGSAELSEAAATRIEDLVQEVPEGAEVSVSGHTDDVPFSGQGGNQALSESRADAVAAVITEARPDLDLEVAGYGESRPVADGDEAAARAQNRRVEIRYDGDGG